MKIYLAYITLPPSEYDTRIKYMIDSRCSTFVYKKGVVTGLYGWTNKKDIIKEFKKSRADIFTIETKMMTDKAYKKFKKDYSDLKLDVRRFYTSRDLRYDNDDLDEAFYRDVITTKFELVAASDDIMQNMFEFGPASYMSYDYMIFNDKIIRALDILNYTRLYDKLNPTNPESDEGIAREEVSDYQEGFDLSTYGSKIIYFDKDEYIALLYLFKYTFLGI